MRQPAHLTLSPGLAADQARALRETHRRETLERQLQIAGRTREEAVAAPKTKDWELRLAQGVREESGAAIGWLTHELGLGSEGTARSLLSKLRRECIPPYSP